MADLRHAVGVEGPKAGACEGELHLTKHDIELGRTDVGGWRTIKRTKLLGALLWTIAYVIAAPIGAARHRRADCHLSSPTNVRSEKRRTDPCPSNSAHLTEAGEPFLLARAFGRAV